MRTGAFVAWWIGLIGALVATLAILKQVALVLGTLRDIHRLAGRTLEAARGIADNVAVVPSLGALAEPALELQVATDAAPVVAAALEAKLNSLTGASAGGG